jgi:hypothetical protein
MELCRITFFMGPKTQLLTSFLLPLRAFCKGHGEREMEVARHGGRV